MTTQKYKIEVFKREEMSKSTLRQLRVDGFIPGIYYAHDQKDAIPFKVESKELRHALQSAALVYHVSVGGKRRNVLIKEIQYHPVTDEILHVDFQGVRMDEEVVVRVPIHTEGRPVGVKDEGGQIHHALLEVEIRCLASEIPSHFELDITELHIGQTIHAGDLDIGNFELVTSPDSMVVSVSKARGMIEEVVAEEVEEEEFLFEEEGAEEGEAPSESKTVSAPRSSPTATSPEEATAMAIGRCSSTRFHRSVPSRATLPTREFTVPKTAPSLADASSLVANPVAAPFGAASRNGTETTLTK